MELGAKTLDTDRGKETPAAAGRAPTPPSGSEKGFTSA